MRGLCCLRGTVESVKTVRISLQRFLICRQRLLRTTHFEQHVSQHFPRGQLDFALSLGILPVGNRTQQAQCFSVYASQARASSRPVSMYLATYASFPLRVASIIASYCVIAARAAAASRSRPAAIARAQ